MKDEGIKEEGCEAAGSKAIKQRKVESAPNTPLERVPGGNTDH